MAKGVLSTTADVVNGIWGIGTEVYKAVSDEIAEAIDDEAKERTRAYFGNDKVDEKSERFLKRFRKERAAVAKEYKSVALKGGLIVLGLGIFS